MCNSQRACAYAFKCPVGSSRRVAHAVLMQSKVAFLFWICSLCLFPLLCCTPMCWSRTRHFAVFALQSRKALSLQVGLYSN